MLTIIYKKSICMMADPSRKATCVKADTLGLPSDHILTMPILM